MIQMIKDVRERAGKPISFKIPNGSREETIDSNSQYSHEDYKYLIWYMFKGRVLSM